MRRLVDTFLATATVADVSNHGGRIQAVALTGADLADLRVTPGQQVRIQARASNALADLVVGALRTYSIWSYDGQTLDLRIFDHGEGPGAQWARTVRPGDRVHLLKPQGDFVCRPSGYHLFAGDETASVAFGAMIRALPDDSPVHCVVEVDTEQEQLPIAGNVVWVHRRGRPAASSTTLVDAVAQLDLPPQPGSAYLAGEAGTIQLIRNHLVRERGWTRRDVLTKPFWAPGKRGLD